MIRSETVIVPAVRGNEPGLVNVYGFAWDAADPANTVLETSVVRVEIEYEDGRHGFIVLRPRAWYGSRQKMTRVWFFSSAGGTAVFDVGLVEGDVALPAASAESVDLPVQRFVSAAGQNFTAAPLVCDFVRPPGARALSVNTRMPANAQVPQGPAFAIDSTGTVGTAALGPVVVIPAVGTVDGRTIDGLVIRAGGVYPAAVGMDNAPARGPQLSIPWLPRGGVRWSVNQFAMDAGKVLSVEGFWER
jgi:hypothetical protein